MFLSNQETLSSFPHEFYEKVGEWKSIPFEFLGSCTFEIAQQQFFSIVVKLLPTIPVQLPNPNLPKDSKCQICISALTLDLPPQTRFGTFTGMLIRPFQTQSHKHGNLNNIFFSWIVHENFCYTQDSTKKWFSVVEK